MNARLQGRLIRQRRQELNWSQEGLCRGICATSYLSKIEQGTVEASDEVLKPLLQRLGLEWNEDDDFCREMGAFIDSIYDLLFSGEGADSYSAELNKRAEACKNSPYYLDWLLLSAAENWSPPVDAEVFLPAMNPKQRMLYDCLCGDYEHLLAEADKSFYYLCVGRECYKHGDYGRAQELLLRGREMALREGALRILLDCHIFLGNCASDLGQLEQALEYYGSASRMARALGEKERGDTIEYNLASTQLMMGRVWQALSHFLAHPIRQDALYHHASTRILYFHKLAICYELLDKKEDSLKMIQCAKSIKDSETDMDERISREMCELVQYRLEHPEYLAEPAYGELLCSLFAKLEADFPRGFVLFHVRWMEEWYTANRKYRQAYELLKKFYTSYSVNGNEKL